MDVAKAHSLCLKGELPAQDLPVLESLSLAKVGIEAALQRARIEEKALSRSRSRRRRAAAFSLEK